MVRGIEGSSLTSNHVHLLLKSGEAGTYMFGMMHISFGSELESVLICLVVIVRNVPLFRYRSTPPFFPSFFDFLLLNFDFPTGSEFSNGFIGLLLYFRAGCR